jgi:pimeloyl-ACP methyl ester carboxylesterase
MRILPYFLSLFSLFIFYHDGQAQVVAVSVQKTPVDYPFGQNKMVGKYYQVRGFRMYVEEYGNGSPVLMIHGNGGSIQSFNQQIPFFSRNFRVIVADSRAQGLSNDSRDTLSYEMMADDYAALLSQMKIDSAQVIGWSDGGIIGLLLAIRNPEKVKKLVVSGANLSPDTTAVNDDVLQLVRPDYQRLVENKNKSAAEANSQKLLRLLLEEPHIELKALHQISCPTLVIGGDHDIVKKSHLVLIAEHISKSYLWIVPGAGHSIPLAFRDVFNANVSDFLNQNYRVISGDKRFN